MTSGSTVGVRESLSPELVLVAPPDEARFGPHLRTPQREARREGADPVRREGLARAVQERPRRDRLLPHAGGARTSVSTPRQQINTVPSFIDALAVYGDSEKRLKWLCSGPFDGNLADNGATLMLPGGYLPHADARGNIGSSSRRYANGTYTPKQLEAFEREGIEVEHGAANAKLVIPLGHAFGNPSLLQTVGLGPLLKRLGEERQYKNDEQIDESAKRPVPGSEARQPRPGKLRNASRRDRRGRRG